MIEKKLKISIVSCLVEEYKSLFFLGAVTFCAVCTIHFLSTVVFCRGEWGEAISAGMTTFSSYGK